MDINNIALATDDFEDKVKALKLRLKSRMNGKTTEQMTNGQVQYNLNYGIAIHHVKELAEESNYTFDDCCRLWKLNIREAMLIAAMCVKDQDATSDKLATWVENIATPDMAEQASFYLFKRIKDIDVFIEKVMSEEYAYGKSVAYFAAARTIQSKRDVSAANIDNALNGIASGNEMTMAEVRGASLLLRQLVIAGKYIERIKEIVAKHALSEVTSMKQLAYEVETEIEMR